MSDAIDNIFDQAVALLDKEFANGIGLRNTRLKNYSAESLEKTSEFILKMIVNELSKKYPTCVIEHSKSYLTPDKKGYSKERMDQHIKINNEYVLLQEDRAWVDKPFYSLKRSVITCIMKTCKKQLYKNVKFIFMGYCLDYKQEIVNTCDYALDHGDRILTYSLTGRQRGKKINGKSVNWYETGYDKDTIRSYIQDVYQILEDAIQNGPKENNSLFR
jgi:hypothetical protein